MGNNGNLDPGTHSTFSSVVYRDLVDSYKYVVVPFSFRKYTEKFEIIYSNPELPRSNLKII